MSMPMLILLTSLLTLVVFMAGIAAYHWWLSHRTPAEIKAGPKRCSECFTPLPMGACRTATGRWLCRDCKGKAA